MNHQLLINFTNDDGNKKIMLIGQAPPKRIDPIPFKKTRLYSWFKSINVNVDEAIRLIEFEALVKQYPGPNKNGRGDAKPSPENISRHIPTLIDKITSKNINVVIPVGKMAIEHVLGKESVNLSEVIGNKYCMKIFNSSSDKEYIVIPLPHPSGLSSWVHTPPNDTLLEKALQKIKHEL